MKIGQVFDEIHEEYTQKMIRWVPHYEQLLNCLVSTLPSEFAPKNILDLGAGNGNATAVTLKRHSSATFQLLDASEQMLQMAREAFRDLKNLTYSECMMQDFALDRNSFDLIIACFSLHHLDKTDKAKIFANIYEWLNPGGYFSYADLFIDRGSVVHASFVKEWESFVLSNGSIEDWEYLIDHYNQYDNPASIEDQLSMLHDVGFKEIKLIVYECYWVHLLARK